jgi:hypothetical protein
LRSLWKETGSQAFGQGCDLLVAAYRTDILPQIQHDDCFSMSAFGQPLTQAIAWMIPIDENLGFMVGVPSDSDFHHSLVDHALPKP